jgi:hypothetical protein
MPRKWVPNAAKRSSGFHETQNAFCLVKAVIIDRAGTTVEKKYGIAAVRHLAERR